MDFVDFTFPPASEEQGARRMGLSFGETHQEIAAWRSRRWVSLSLNPSYAGRLCGIAALIPHHHQAVVAGFAAPGLARTAQHLAHAGAALVAWEGFERLGYRIESLDRIGEPVGRPYPVLVIHIDRIGAGGALRHRPHFPALGRRIVAADPAGVPEAHPQHAF